MLDLNEPKPLKCITTSLPQENFPVPAPHYVTMQLIMQLHDV